MEARTFFRALAVAWALGAGTGYAVRRSGIDERFNDWRKARVEASNRRYAQIMGEEIGSRIIVVTPVPEIGPHPEEVK